MVERVAKSGIIDPSGDPFAATPSDTVDFARVAKALYIGGGGNVVVLAEDGNTAITFSTVPSGYILPVRVRRILVTGTTATNIIGL
jgi:hypothetical protein